MRERVDPPSLRTTLALIAGLTAAGCGGGGPEEKEIDMCPGTTLSQEVDRVLNPDIYEGECAVDDTETDTGSGEEADCVEPPPLPRLSIQFPDGNPNGSHEAANGNYRIYFNIPPFDERAIAEFIDNGCSAFPLEVRVRGHLLTHPSQLEGDGESVLGEEIIGRKTVNDPRPDSVETAVPPGKVLVSYMLELVLPGTPDGTPPLAQTTSVEVENYGPAQNDCSFEDCPEEQEGETPTAAPAEGNIQ